MSAELHPLAALETLSGYRQHFMDLELWHPYVIALCARHGLAPCDQVTAGLPGTCPAFGVEDRWLVKLFGRLFDGAACFAAEREANRLLAAHDRAFPAPAIVAAGELLSADAGWPWLYLIYEFIPGVSVGEVWSQLEDGERLAVARELGALLRRLHSLPLIGSTVFPDTWDAHLAFLAEQTVQATHSARAWASLPEHLIDQIDGYLLPPEALIGSGERPHLIHADLNRDHLLGRQAGAHWSTLGVIDFGDAMTGCLAYELVALHLGLFRGDRALLSACLDAYGLPAEDRRTLPARAMTATFLHRFDVLSDVPLEGQVRDLAQWAEMLWDVA